MIIHAKSYARIGLIGNPSDGFYGKTISCAIRVFGNQEIQSSAAAKIQAKRS